jgi:hypothetical protein
MRGAKKSQFGGITGANPPKFSMARQLLLSINIRQHKLGLADKLGSPQLVFFFAQNRKAGAIRTGEILFRFLH